MSPTRARFAYDVLRATVLTVAVGGALVTMTGHLDGPAGQTAGTATVQLGTVVEGLEAGNFNARTALDVAQVEEGAPIRAISVNDTLEPWHHGE